MQKGDNRVFEQDYIMRLIKEMIRTILKLLFNMDAQSPAEELLESKEEKEILDNLLDLVDEGNINEAENRIYDLICNKNYNGLAIALLFYSYLNDKTDDFLESNDFSRKEVKEGIERVADSLGLDSVTKIFLTDF